MASKRRTQTDGCLTPARAVERLAVLDGAEFTTLFEHGSLEVEIYRPAGVDRQKPHDRDELYVVVAGSGEFIRGNERVSFTSGDLLFVAANVPHRFENFTPDFVTWVMFWGPAGGEVPQSS